MPPFDIDNRDAGASDPKFRIADLDATLRRLEQLLNAQQKSDGLAATVVGALRETLIAQYGSDDRDGMVRAALRFVEALEDAIRVPHVGVPSGGLF